MTNKDLFKEAIADAKQVREAALANAKSALEEALTPKLQSMLSMKLQEMEDEDLDEGSSYEETDENLMNEEDLEEDFDLSAILAELDNEEMDEAKDEEDYGTNIVTGEKLPKPDPIVEEEEEGEEEETEGSEEGEEEVNIADLSVDDLKDLIKDIISQEMDSDEMEMGDDEIMGGEEEMMDVTGDDEDEINLDELLAELDALEENKDEKEDDLKEAISTINTLRTELQEVNLLNAKLLYVNKIFKAKNLTESQKVKVITSFDKATTAKEAKIVFESLNSALTMNTTTQKNTIKESLGFASKAAGNAPTKQIVEVNDSISRMQRLAGIIN
jgi:hypothetical protein